MMFIKDIIWFVKSDVDLQTTRYWYRGKEYIDGFYFYSKQPFSKSYQYHGTLGLENTYKILALIESIMRDKKKKGFLLQISAGIGTERVYIWRSSLSKARNLLFEMIKEIQKQY